MQTFTREPRLLVKLPAPFTGTAAGGAGLGLAPFALRFRDQPISVRLEPLFTRIPPASTGTLAAAAPGIWHVLSAAESGTEVNVWDLCHSVVREGFGVTGLERATFAEPDLEQRWVIGTAVQHALAAAAGCVQQPADSRLPNGTNEFWFRDAQHSQLEAARTVVGTPADRVRIAHLDTGYDPGHKTLPKFLLIKNPKNLQKNFVDAAHPDDATDRTSAGILTNVGHGTGTLSLLAGNVFAGAPLGGAPFLDVIPIRVANSVVLFRNSAIAKALDYVHQLFADPARRAHVVTMSMGGLASQAWADAVNALYELGVFIVTAAGNNFGNRPTRFIVFPARFRRVVAACGVMANSTPYANLPLTVMAGNYGPKSKMTTAMAAWTPNTPWAKLGCSAIVNLDGAGTSAAAPQVAAAAALWIQQHKAAWEKYPQGWMRVEAVRKALFESAAGGSGKPDEFFGRDLLLATHEHWDHLSGFVQAAQNFKAIRFDRVWLAWTEDPDDELARKLGGERMQLRMALASAAARLHFDGGGGDGVVDGMLEFFGAAGQGTTKDALDVVKALAKPRFCRPTEDPVQFPGARLYVLGPPHDEKLIKRYNPSKAHPETFGLAGLFLDQSAPSITAPDVGAPFDPLVQIPNTAAQSMRFFQEHYWGEARPAAAPDAAQEADTQADQAWRRIDGDWLDLSSDLALQLDSATNNTSLALAIELTDGRVLLFAADAQVGNWLSWQDLSWKVGGKTVTGSDLLRRTVLYKTGHHGSHNATLREKGLELMDRLEIALIPVDHEMAVKKRWGKMPFEALEARLNEKTKGRVLRIDKPVPPALASAVVQDAGGSLYYEVKL